MRKTRRTKKTKKYFRYYLFTCLLVYITVAVSSYFYLKPKLAFKVPFIENIESQQTEAKQDKEEVNPLRLYRSRLNNISANKDLINAEDAIKKYLKPLKIKLLDLYMDKKGTIYADFSGELRKNFKGDASEEYRIIADLYRKIKITVPAFRSLKILIDGKEAESFGGHIDISKPIGEKIEGVIQRKTYRYF